MELLFEKLSCFERLDEPCAVAIPFPCGRLFNPANLAILDQGKPMPIQPEIKAAWPDGSIKWLYVDFLANLPANAGKVFEIESSSSEIGQAAPTVQAQIVREGAKWFLDSGLVQIELKQPGESGIFGRVVGRGFQIADGSLKGPLLYMGDDSEWIARIDETGWRIIKPGPVIVSVLARGKHGNSAGTARMDFEIELTAYAGKPYLRVDYRIINRELEPEVELTGMEFVFSSRVETPEILRTALATSNYKSKIESGTGVERLEAIIDADYLLYDSNEHFPETFYGTFWADWNHRERGGLCITQYQAYQNFPKSFSVGRQGIVSGILPRGCAINLLQGVAKSHCFYLHFHAAEIGLEALNIQSLQFQLPDRPVLKPEIYHDAGVLENIFVKSKLNWVERSLINLADCRVRAYGFLAWGDAPDEGYSDQGRGRGALVWTNNEYDFPHAAMLLYVKTGERRFLDYMLVAARHQMDLDVCHFSEDPLRFKGHITHSAYHATGEVSLCHQWVEGLLDYYHVTGESRALETALGIGQNVKRLLEQPRYQKVGESNARETGWALRILVALYRETHDPNWLEPAETIVNHFETWKDTYGCWLAPYTDHTVIRVPFMIAVAVNSLMRYYRVWPQERIKRMIVDAVSDLIDHCRLENGIFYYKELPSLRRNGNNLQLLEALAYAYELTGKRRFLEAGLPTFELGAQINWQSGQSKRAMEDAVIVANGPGPKRFAQSFYALAYFYRIAVEAEVLK